MEGDEVRAQLAKGYEHVLAAWHKHTWKLDAEKLRISLLVRPRVKLPVNKMHYILRSKRPDKIAATIMFVLQAHNPRQTIDESRLEI